MAITRVWVSCCMFGLACSGLPRGKEFEILGEYHGEVPAEVFTTPYSNPVGGSPRKDRKNLLCSDAVWKPQK